MKKILTSVLAAAVVLAAAFTPLEAGQSYSEPAPAKKRCFLFGHCRDVTDYKPPRGVFVIVAGRRIRKYKVLRHVKFHGGGETTYTETVIIYRNHYSDGSTHTWTCVVEGSRVDQGK